MQFQPARDLRQQEALGCQGNECEVRVEPMLPADLGAYLCAPPIG